VRRENDSAWLKKTKIKNPEGKKHWEIISFYSIIAVKKLKND